MRRELRLLERQQMTQRYYNEQQQQQQQLQSNSSTTSSQPSEKDNGSKEYLRQLEKEYIAQIDKYKELLKYESDRLKHTRQEFLEYVHDKTREIENLQQQIRHLKGKTSISIVNLLCRTNWIVSIRICSQYEL